MCTAAKNKMKAARQKVRKGKNRKGHIGICKLEKFWFDIYAVGFFLQHPP